MASSGIRRGFDLKTYRNTGTFGSPVWSELTGVRDQTLGAERTKIESSIRGYGGIATKVPGMLNISPSWEMPYDQADANLVALQTALWATTVAGNQMEFAFSDGPIAGSNIRYIRAFCSVFKVEEGQPLDGIDMCKVEVEPTYNGTTNPPAVFTA